MFVCMVTPHMPPEQAANALLPSVLARELGQAGHRMTFLSHGAGTGAGAARRDVMTVARRGQGALARSQAGAVWTAARLALASARAIRPADLVHLHSNGFIIDVAGWTAARWGRPSVITLYGTDVWHFDPVRHRRFAAVVRQASERVFYSRALRDRAVELGLATDAAPVIYAPVDDAFVQITTEQRAEARKSLGLSRPTVLTVKRLHTVAGHDVLLRACAQVVRQMPGVTFLIAGDGELRPDLERQAAALGLSSSVRFLGMIDNRELPRYYAAADLFVLPSRLESWGTVMLEALACGTPVVATETAGAREAHDCFADDLTLTPLEADKPLAEAIVRALETPRRTGAATARRIEATFRPAGCAQAYAAIYAAALRRC